jgi:hypothetical protein
MHQPFDLHLQAAAAELAREGPSRSYCHRGEDVLAGVPLAELSSCREALLQRAPPAEPELEQRGSHVRSFCINSSCVVSMRRGGSRLGGDGRFWCRDSSHVHETATHGVLATLIQRMLGEIAEDCGGDGNP